MGTNIRPSEYWTESRNLNWSWKKFWLEIQVRDTGRKWTPAPVKKEKEQEQHEVSRPAWCELGHQQTAGTMVAMLRLACHGIYKS